MDKNEVKFKYYFDDSYDPEYVNGTYGGPTPNGELVMHFFMDRFPIPYEVTQGLSSEGTPDINKVMVYPDQEEALIRRTIKTGIIMSPDTAISIYKWLKDRLCEMGVEENDL